MPWNKIIGASVAFLVGWLSACYITGRPVIVHETSMRPYLSDGSWSLYRNLFPWERVHRGDVVILQNHAIKRVIGLPGDTIRMSLGYVFLNGKRFDEPYVPRTMPTAAGAFGEEITIAAGEYVVMGDNRQESYDSREYGPVRRSQIAGKLRF